MENLEKEKILDWKEISENYFIRDFYDFQDRLAAVIVHNGVAVLIQCNFEFHFLMSHDFFSSNGEISYVKFAVSENGNTVFTKAAESNFDVQVLEAVHKKLTESSI